MNNRYRGLKPHPEALGVTLLKAGEKSLPVRIRASEAVHAWLSEMSADERGQLLEEVMVARSAKSTSAKRPLKSHRRVLDALRSGGRILLEGNQYRVYGAQEEVWGVRPQTLVDMARMGLLVTVNGQYMLPDAPGLL